MCLFDLFVIYRVEMCDLLFWCVKSDCAECVCALVCDGVWCECVRLCVFLCVVCVVCDGVLILCVVCVRVCLA